jgi:acetoin utilization protein AcuB
VVEDGKVVGIVTTNDFFYLILNPVLGIGEKGSRVVVRHCTTPLQMAAALQCAAELGMDVINAAYLPSRRGGERDFLVHVSAEDPTALVAAMKTKGLEADARER